MYVNSEYSDDIIIKSHDLIDSVHAMCLLMQ